MSFFDKPEVEEEDAIDTSAMENDEDEGSEEETSEKSSKRNEWKENLEKILAFCRDNGAPEEVMDACKRVRPSFFGIARSGGGGFTKQEFTADQKRLAELVGKASFDDVEIGDNFSEMKAFQTLRFGRKDINWMIKSLIKTPGQKVQAWLSYDVDTGVTEVVALGDMPADWNGYVPKTGDAE